MNNTNNITEEQKPRSGGSAAIWCTSKVQPDESHKPSLELHFNFWRHISKSQKGQERDYLDIGLMVSNSKALKSLHIYLPAHIDKNDVVDLSSLFKEATIATGIFNTSLTATNSTSTTDPIDLTDPKAGRFFARVCCLSQTKEKLPDPSELTVEKYSGGSLITITEKSILRSRKGLQDGQRIYFRIRVKWPISESNAFVNVITPPDRWFLSGIDNVEYIDFRLNQVRNLPDEIQRLKSDAETASPQSISRVDFLLVVGVTADLVSSHQFHKHRMLENELWKAYISNGEKIKLPEGMVIYHWRDKSDSVDEFNALAKFRIRKSAVKRYLAVAFGIGAIGSLLASVIWSLPGWIKGTDPIAEPVFSFTVESCESGAQIGKVDASFGSIKTKSGFICLRRKEK